MGLFSQLFGGGSGSRQVLVAAIQGPGKYACPVVGESNYQDALERICGGRSENGADKEVVARLVYEPENPYDDQAVRVDVDGTTVGYLDRDTARSFRVQLAEAAPGVSIAQANAVIRGGWLRGDDQGHFGIWLDVPIGGPGPTLPEREPQRARAAPLDEQAQPPGAINAERRFTRDLDELLGWCRGIVADECVNAKEAEALDFWIATHPETAQAWPGSVLSDRLRRIFVDGELHEDELQELGALVQEITANEMAFTDIPTTSTLPLDQPPPDIEFEGRSFCLTGNFVYGTRRHCEGLIEERGGIVLKAPRRDLDYLVLGILASRDWAHSGFGRKIEKVMEYKQKGSPIAVVSERHWAAYLAG